MSGFSITSDAGRCVRCGACEAVCPSGVFAWIDDRLTVRFAGRCIRCGHCVAVCPEDALDHSELKKDRFGPLPRRRPVATEALDALFKRRRSCRRFLDKPLARTEIEELLDQACYAPTPTNSQNVRFIVFDNSEAVRSLSEWTARYYLKLERQMKNPVVRGAIGLAVGKKTVSAYRFHMPVIAGQFQEVLKGERKLFHGASAVVVAFASGMSHIALASCNLAAMQIMLACEARQLGSCYNGYALTALTRDKAMRKSIGIPVDSTPGAVIAIGWPDGGFARIPPRKKRRVVWFDGDPG